MGPEDEDDLELGEPEPTAAPIQEEDTSDENTAKDPDILFQIEALRALANLGEQ